MSKKERTPEQNKYLDDLSYCRKPKRRENAVHNITGKDMNVEQGKAFLIHLAKSQQDEENASIAIDGWGLLDGFQAFTSMKARRNEYIRRSGLGISNTALTHREEDIYAFLSESWVNIEKNPKAVEAFFDAAYAKYLVDGKAVYPEPYYIAQRPKVNNLPYENGNFIGRVAVLDTIKGTFLNGQPIIILHGIGGIGKTQIALKYAYSHPDRHQHVAWIDASTASKIHESCKEFLDAAGIAVSPITIDTVRSEFIKYFIHHEKWLIVFDNANYLDVQQDLSKEVNEREVLKSYIPKSSGEILITTRCNSEYENAIRIEITGFEPKTATEYLCKMSGQVENDDAKALSQKLAYHPLALSHAAAYIRSQKGKYSYRDYIDRWNRLGAEVFDTPFLGTTVRGTLEITWDLFRQANSEFANAVLQLLRLCSVLSPESIHLNLFSDYSDLLPSPLGQLIKTEVQRERLIRQVSEYSLMDWDGECLSMHPLVQELICHSMGDEARKSWLDLAYTILFVKHCKEPFDNSNGVDTATLPDTIVEDLSHLQSVIRLILRDNIEPSSSKDDLDSFINWGWHAIIDQKEYALIYPEEMTEIDLLILQIISIIRLKKPAKNNRIPTVDAMLANAYICCHQYEAAISPTLSAVSKLDSVVQDLFDQGETSNLKLLLHTCTMLCDQLFSQTTAIGDSSLLRRIFATRNRLVEAELIFCPEQYDLHHALDMIFYSKLECSLKRPIIFKALPPPDLQNQGEKPFVTFLGDSFRVGSSLERDWEATAECIVDVQINNSKTAIEELTHFLKPDAPDWQIIALPEALYGPKAIQEFINLLPQDIRPHNTI